MKFDVESQLEVSSDSGFNADYIGFEYSAGDGKGVNGSASGGGGYGGSGGDGYRISGGVIYDGGVSYGNSNAPVRPGSGGGYYHGASTLISRATGGGLIWIHAPIAKVKMDGLMTANGQNVGGSWGGGASGGGSGGAIFIDCLLFEGQGLLSACGGNGWSGSAGYGGSGGGGRIAVRRAVHKWSGSPSPGSADDRVKGGDIVNASHPETEGHDGTIVWIEAPPGGVVVLFR